MSCLDDWLKANPIEMHRLTALTKAKTPSMNNPGPAWSELMVYARVKLELGEVSDILQGLARASEEHPELREAYEAEQLACLEGKTLPTTDDDGLLKHRKEAGMDTPPPPPPPR